MNIMAVFILGSSLFNTILGGNSIGMPTREEQVDLLTSVQEVFDQVKLLVNIETNATDESVINDIVKNIERAQHQLSLVEELNLNKLSSNYNSVAMLDSKTMIQDLIQRGSQELDDCAQECFDAVTNNTNRLRNITQSSVFPGEDFIQYLRECSKKPVTLEQLKCYKKVIANEVTPVKGRLLKAIDIHKNVHLRMIQIRNDANDCIDRVLDQLFLEITGIVEDTPKSS